MMIKGRRRSLGPAEGDYILLGRSVQASEAISPMNDEMRHRKTIFLQEALVQS
jgi:hypothetical protein